jgi:hypothetical protein
LLHGVIGRVLTPTPPVEDHQHDRSPHVVPSSLILQSSSPVIRQNKRFPKTFRFLKAFPRHVTARLLPRSPV